MEDPAKNCSTNRGHGEAFSIDTRTRLCSWGANGHGQLGQGHTVDQLLPVPVKLDLLPPDGHHTHTGVSCIGGGGGFSFIVTGSGHLLTCGNNDRGQLGRHDSPTGPEVKATQVSVFTPCTFMPRVKVTKAASGWDFLLALVDNGNVYSWGSNSFGQLGRTLDESGKQKQSSTPGQVIFPCNGPQHDIAAGLRHALSVSEEGHVYAWGHGKKGQLGSEVKKVPGGKSVAISPQKVPFPCSVRIKSVFAGMYHCGGLDDSGTVFVWGCNAYGQCGINRETNPCVITPTKQHIPCKDGECVVAVCSGWTHLVARTDKGNLYSWGRSNLGQLGRRCEEGCDPRPGLVDGLLHVTTHACGSEHNIALSESKVSTWGWNEHGICATGDETDLPLPRHVTSLYSNGDLNPSNAVLRSVGCGTGHTFAILQQIS